MSDDADICATCGKPLEEEPGHSCIGRQWHHTICVHDRWLAGSTKALASVLEDLENNHKSVLASLSRTRAQLATALSERAALESEAAALREKIRVMGEALEPFAASAAEYDPAYADPLHPGNKIRPRVMCMGCGTKGCVTYWGPWCFACNVKRIGHIDSKFQAISALIETEANKP